ncbi:hypothetical protein [Mangrovibacterium lignilyticum]|uniref:hypothetical protein n=1 Tax=Mangrovibacterium lignilyticum TaxID=2668052 RepID=UPI0013D50EBA|nr:hypothetical protein [Mangrovibacterium lignilyticum]
MKQLPVLFLFILFAFVSCEEDSNTLTSIKGDSGITYDESYSQWQKLKAQNGNSYTYTLSFTSWTGYGSATTLTIEDGLVAERSYVSYEMKYPENEMVVLESYTETGDDLGSHDKGVPLFNIDDLYDTCASDYLVVDEANNTLYFNTDPTGIMNTCGYVPDNCADDCYVGINIESFSWLSE